MVLLRQVSSYCSWSPEDILIDEGGIWLVWCDNQEALGEAFAHYKIQSMQNDLISVGHGLYEGTKQVGYFGPSGLVFHDSLEHEKDYTTWTRDEFAKFNRKQLDENFEIFLRQARKWHSVSGSH